MCECAVVAIYDMPQHDADVAVMWFWFVSSIGLLVGAVESYCRLAAESGRAHVGRCLRYSQAVWHSAARL